MCEPLPTGQLRQTAARLVGQTLQLTDDITELAQLVEATGIELSAATRHAIELELHDAARAVHRLALSLRERAAAATHIQEPSGDQSRRRRPA